jgi:hypothetical protein
MAASRRGIPKSSLRRSSTTQAHEKGVALTATTFLRRAAGVGAIAALASGLVLFLAPPAKPDAAPLLSLGPVSVANGTATLSGTVTGAPAAGLQLHANGQPLGLNADGTFSGTVDLAGQSLLTVSAKNPLSGETVTTQIPLNTNLVGPDGLIQTTVLDALKKAGISLAIPPGGFVSVDGLPIKVDGKVLDKDQLASLKVNGVDVLDKLNSAGAFSQSVPGSSREVSVSATDKQGVTQTTSFGVVPTSSVISTAAGPSVAAAGAVGITIAKVRYITKTVRAKKRFRMIVTVKDRQNRLVRGATVRMRLAASPGKRFVRGKQQRMKRSGKLGQVNFLMLVRKPALGKRVAMITTAQTPTAKAQKKTSVRLPKAKAKKTKRARAGI